MFKAILKLFGIGQVSCSCGCSGRGATGGQKLGDLEHFVDYVVRALVDFPDEVSVETVENDEGVTIRISCRKEDIGKVVGKRGKTVMAIRSLVSGAAGRLQKRVSVEVVD